MVDATHDSAITGHGQTAWLPHIKTVSTEHPWAWLSAGWRDLCAAPTVSLAYGVLAVVSSFVLVAGLGMYDLHYLILPMAAGFMILGPIFAVGLYEASRLLEKGEKPTLGRVAMAYRRNSTQILAMGLALMVVFFAWLRLAFLLFMMFFSAEPPTLDMIVTKIFFSDVTIPFLLVGSAVGFVMAAAVFSMSVVAIPMLLDRECDVFTAMATSVKAVRDNPRPMVVWAALIVLFTAAGIVTGFLGLLLALPLIGHASWHAYRGTVESEG